MLGSLILLSSGLFFLLMGISLLDMTLAAALTASLSLLLRALEARHPPEQRKWMLLSGACCGLGMLTKGPVAPAVIVVALGLYALRRRHRLLLGNLNWISWMNACLLVAIPGFAFVEYHNPGFLRYFFINENFLRYTIAEYGDLYGAGHQRAYGTSWFYLAVSFLPWTPLLVAVLWYRLRRRKWQEPGFGGDERVLTEQDLREYLLCWGLAPAVFFTFARQHLATYILPGIPGLAAYLAYEFDVLACLLQARLLSWFRKGLDYILFGTALFFILWGFYTGEPWSAILGVLLFLMLLVALSRLMSAVDSYEIAGRCSFVAALTMAIGVISFDAYCGGFASTRDILDYIRNGVVHTGSIHFPIEVPNSAYLYHPELRDTRPHDEESCPDGDLCIIRRKDLSPRIKMYAPLDVLTQAGKWVVFTKP